ncbi:MAG: TonB-dependent receptor [bacterium]|nr:TonB-dependent receptor [bacterium]
MNRILGAVVVCAALVLAQGEAPASERAQYRGRPLIEVLEQFERAGFELIYTSAVVGDELRVEIEPHTSDPREALERILAASGLKAEDGPGDSILVLPEDPPVGTFRGRIVSLARGGPIPGATVRVVGTDRFARASDDGSFAIGDLPEAVYEITVTSPGFSTATLRRVHVSAERDVDLTVELKARPTFVTEVVVTPNRHSVVRQEQAARRSVTNDEAVLAPSIGGDISRVVELLPGVTAADGSAAFNVRGSTARDVSLVLDGLELYDPFHLQSFQSPFSVIDTNVVDRIDFFGGGYTADLGDRHGGFVDIATVNPRDERHGEFEIGTQNSRFSYRMPLAEGAGDWLVSTRAWYPEAVWDTTELGGGENIDPRFGDLYTKVAFRLSKKHQLSGHALVAYDRVEFQEKNEKVNESVDAETSNSYWWSRLTSVWNPKWSSETMLSGGNIERDRDGVSSEDGAIVVEDHRAVDFVGIKHDSTWNVSDAHVVRAGVDARYLKSRYRYSNLFDEEPEDNIDLALRPEGSSIGVYTAWRARITDKFAAELGVRWDRQDYTNDNQLSPRINAVWRPNERSEVRVAVGRYFQSQRIHELQIEDGETTFGPAEASKQAELSLRHRFKKGPRVRLDLYHRELTDLRPRYENLFEPVELFPETTEDRVRITPLSARLAGAELLVRGDADRRLFWWVSYTRAVAEDEDSVENRDIPRSWDQPHAGKFLVGYRLGERWSVSLSGTAHTGWPITPVTGELDDEGEPEEVWGPRNSSRYPEYRRLDFKARRSFVVGHGRLWLTVEIVNLLNRDNACCVDEFEFEVHPDDTVDVTTRYDYWLGTTPSVSVLWEF